MFKQVDGKKVKVSDEEMEDLLRQRKVNAINRVAREKKQLDEEKNKLRLEILEMKAEGLI